MNETAKTLVFVAVAAGGGVVPGFKPSPPSRGDRRECGTSCSFPTSDPLTAASLEIVEYDEDTATVRPFEVANQVKGSRCGRSPRTTTIPPTPRTSWPKRPPA